MVEKRTMTLNLTEEEMGLLDELSSRYDMSKTAIMRKVLRMYRIIDDLIQKGEKLFLKDGVLNKKSEIVVL